jgi:DNA-binding transcriptional MerR regulator
MVRKRNYSTRQRSKRTRPKTPAPTNGWLLDELARLTQTPRRRLRYYLEHRLIEPLERRGTATRYDRRAFLRVLGIVRLRAEGGANLSQIRRKLDGLGERGLEEWLRTQPLPPSAAAALGMTNELNGGAATAGAEGMAQLNSRRPDEKNAAMWQRVCLLPGLELMLAANASPVVIRAAQQICEEFVGGQETRPTES